MSEVSLLETTLLCSVWSIDRHRVDSASDLAVSSVDQDAMKIESADTLSNYRIGLLHSMYSVKIRGIVIFRNSSRYFALQFIYYITNIIDFWNKVVLEDH